MRLVFFEIKKMMFKPILIILLAVFTAADIYLLAVNSSEYAPFSSMKSAEDFFNSCCEKVEGQLTNDSIEWVIDRYNESASKISGDFSTKYDADQSYTGYLQMDYNVFSELYNGMKQAYRYGDNTEKIIEKAKENAAYFSQNNIPVQAEKFNSMISVYEGRHIDSFYRTDGFEAYFAHNLSSLLALLITVFALAGAVSSERENDMVSLILPSKRGTNGVIWPRLAAAAVMSVFFVVWFTAVDIATVAVTNGLYGWQNPLYSLPEYTYTSVNYSIGMHVTISALLKIVGLCTVSFGIIAISSLSRSTLISFSVSIAMLIALIVIDDRALFIGSTKFVSFLNPVSLFTLQDIIKSYATVQLFGYNLTSFIAAVCTGLFVMLALFIVSAAVLRLSARKARRNSR